MSLKADDEGKNKRLSTTQKEILVEFLEKHPELKSGKFSATFTNKTSTSLWKEVAGLLNAVPLAAIKTHDQWRKDFGGSEKVDATFNDCDSFADSGDEDDNNDKENFDVSMIRRDRVEENGFPTESRNLTATATITPSIRIY
ncbi:hypothetical protein Bhyg_02877 [Pseudolycoriella hygida]|uniref:Regulatory protein zeste n=1 Tax=Pseudolycoriella hygida TaxID=35572 RepID=A0A9Q0NCC9_9DIPT|nr:hypothetical protein Bhyg_02877 [Pseudolycoriella hygida]